MLEMLGIPNCDSVKKARSWLDAHGVAYRFRDVRITPLSAAEWRALVQSDRDASLINTRSPSFRKTGVSSQDLADPEQRVQLLLAEPTAMKRPAMVREGALLKVGFHEGPFSELFG